MSINGIKYYIINHKVEEKKDGIYIKDKKDK